MANAVYLSMRMAIQALRRLQLSTSACMSRCVRLLMKICDLMRIELELPTPKIGQKQ